MFTHAVLFEIAPKFVKMYIKDCKMWAREARKALGFISYQTVKRIGHKNQYASIYSWRNKSNHSDFMNKNHEDLVSRSKAPVKVLGYYNFDTIGKVVRKNSN